MKNKLVVNVSDAERIVAGVIGVALLATAVRRAGPLRVLAVAGLFYRAFTGNCKGYEALGVSTCPLKSKP